MEALGFSGGIWLFWDEADVSIEVITWNMQVMNAVVKGKDRDWLLSAVYASADEASRNPLWNYLTQVGLAIQFPWLLVGDFNEILASKEKKGGRPFWRERNHNMQPFIDQCNLIDLGFSGPGLTWTNFRDGRANVRKRLDRAISNRKWRLFFPEAQVVHLARTHNI